MYKGIVFYDPSNKYHDYVAAGFGHREWTTLILPHRRHSTAFLDVEMLPTEDMFLFEVDLTSIGPIFHFPVPIIGTVIPAFNNMKIDEVRDKVLGEFKIKYTPQGEHRSLNYSAQEIYYHYQKPVVVLLINGDEPSTETEYSRSDWWDEEVWRETVKASKPSRNPDMPYTIAECSVHNLEVIPRLLAQHFNLSADALQSNTNAASVRHPSLQNVTIHPESLGIGSDGRSISYRFVSDCLDSLMPTDSQFRIWVDVVQPPLTGQRQVPSYKSEEWWAWEENRLQYKYEEREATLAMPSLSPNAHNHIEPAFHVYFEIDGLVYDNLMAFQEHIPIGDFQSRLNSTWRTTIEVSPQMTAEEAKSALENIVDEIMCGVIP